MLNKINDAIADLDIGERLFMDDVPAEIYHASIGLGSSLMKAATQSMAHYHYAKTATRKTTPAMELGSAAHCLLLEPDDFYQRFMPVPDGMADRRTKAYKEWAAQYPHHTILSASDWEIIQGMMDAIQKYGGEYFSNGVAERSYWYRHESGLVLKARLDYELIGNIIDFKTTQATSKTDFAKSVKYDYSVQDAQYLMVTNLDEMMFVGCCKAPPHQMYLSQPPIEMRDYKKRVIDFTCREILKAEETQSYSQRPMELCIAEYNGWDRQVEDLQIHP